MVATMAVTMTRFETRPANTLNEPQTVAMTSATRVAFGSAGAFAQPPLHTCTTKR
jgi:hypothetical protein